MHIAWFGGCESVNVRAHFAYARLKAPMLTACARESSCQETL